ncbi:low affinity Fe/Cu permease [Variovorax sp. SG517]|uniref:low affinity iron permease family protein n=1 Tax=Variovorax sp. SG517 TaxID=2587117 RepID=UPI00159E4BBF|nr:low affinity iron permease family protein [Variovorax sp. SG517]NVM88605.1 low affinity Fe/Cu permease [Variovorax sp. SG517]
MDQIFARFANRIAHIAGSPITFLACVSLVIAWAVAGPFFGFSETWQLLINTGTTIVTFLMVFLIQNTQNRDGVALQTKLDELIRSSDAQDEFIGIEKLTDQELTILHERCEAAARKSRVTLERTRAERRRRGHEQPARRHEAPEAGQG